MIVILHCILVEMLIFTSDSELALILIDYDDRRRIASNSSSGRRCGKDELMWAQILDEFYPSIDEFA